MPPSNFNKRQDKRIARLYLSGKTTEQIANMYGVYKQSVLNSLKRSGISRRKVWQRANREKNGQWKGGVRIIKGYIHILLPHHHLARKDGYVPEHRLVMEEYMGRALLKEEVVNHKDGNRLNNNTNNLEVFSDNGKHMKMHAYYFLRDKKGRFSSVK